jgi:hypothetical protein
MTKPPTTEAEVREAYDKLVAEIARLHRCTGRGDHGPIGNLRCVLDAVLSIREDRDELQKRCDELEKERDELRSQLERGGVVSGEAGEAD